MQFHRYLIAFAAIVLTASSACVDETEEAVENVVVEVRDDGDAEPNVIDGDAPTLLSVSDREALLIIHEGILTSQGERAVDVDTVYDAPVYVGPDDDGLGDPHWITRAQILDDDGEPLWTQRTNSLFQLLEFLQVVMEEQSPIDIGIEAIYQIVLQDYPELLRFAIKIPRHLPDAKTYRLEVTDETGAFHEIAAYEISELEALAEEPDPDFHYEIDRIVDSGPSSDRLNVAILGDGYTDDQRHRFEGDAQAVAERFLATSPMREHVDLFNIHSIWTPSEESGAGYDCNRPNAPSSCTQAFRDTVFETTFVIPAIADRLNFDLDGVSDRVAMPLQLERIYEVAALAHYDEIIFISNSGKRSGFAGLYVAVVTNFDNRNAFPDVAVHEVGHTLGLLGDEYNISGDACYFNEPVIPLPANISEVIERQVQWSDWVEQDTPIPTPTTGEYDDRVGAFPGAYNCDFLVRPERECMMKRSGDDFCSVCAEQMVRRFYAMIDPAPLEAIEIWRDDRDTIQLTMPLRGDGSRYEVNWELQDGALFMDQPSIELGDPDLPPGEWVDVTVSIHNRTDFVRTVDQAVSSERTFQLRRAVE